MISIRCEPPLQVSGRTLIVVSRVSIGWFQQKGALFFCGDKRPLAIIIRGRGSEEIFGVDGRRIDASVLQSLINTATKQSRGA